MTRATRKDEFMKTVLENEAMIRKIVHIYADSREEREDLQQEIICQLWKSWDSFEQRSGRHTWMYRVALNTALYQRKKNRVQYVRLEDHSADVSGYDPGSDRQEELELLFQAIRQLPELDRALLMLSLERMTYAQIGEVMGLTEKNVSVRIHRIRLRLKEMFKM